MPSRPAKSARRTFKPARLTLGLSASVALAGALLVGTRSLAEGPAEPEIELPEFERTEAEDEVYRLYAEHKLLTARRKVEALLEDDPDSIVGNFVFGNVLRDAEGQLPEAMQHLGRARELYERRYDPTVRTPGSPWLLHREILFSIQSLAAELEQHEYRLQILDYYDSLYDPNLTAEHAWPLMQLERYDEAREYAEKAASMAPPQQRSLGLNAACAVEAEAGSRQARFDACLAAFDFANERARLDARDAPPDQRTPLAVHAYNAALAAQSIGRLDETERLALEGVKRLEFTPANPWRLLVRTYVDQARMEEALTALREMQDWRRRQPAYMRDQDRAETDAAYATFLLVAGETERAERAASRALDRPDRRGLTSSSAEQALGANALLRRAIRRTHAERLREAASWNGTVDRWRGRGRAARSALASRGDDERVTAVLTEDARLYATFRFHVSGGLEPVPPWLLGDLVDVLGPGVVHVGLERAAQMESDAEDGMPELTEGYRDAVEAEVALAWGDERECRRLAESALAKLPDAEVLLRARVLAVASEAARRQGDTAAQVELLTGAMDADAGVIRRLGLSLPVRIKNRGSGGAAARLETLLGRSPRLHRGDGFEVVIEGEGDGLGACLVSLQGAQLACAQLPAPATTEEAGEAPPRDGDDDGGKAEPDGPLSDDDIAAGVAEAFHDEAFAMPVGLANIDLGSLDGTATVSEEAVREKMQGVLDGIMEQ